MQRLTLSTGLLLAFCLAGAARAQAYTITQQDREQAACFDDVQRLCGDAIPDVDRVKACMTQKRAQVSRGCAKYYVNGKPPG